jgi:hypothetical protein
MSLTKIICLLQDGRIASIDIDSSVKVSSFNTEHLQKIKFKSGLEKLERECDYDYTDDKMITIYAWNKGRSGNENKHELPPPIDNNMYYGDIFALCHINDKLCDLSVSEYKKFYEDAFGGFEDIADDSERESTEDEDDAEDLKDFIVSDDDDDETNEESDDEDGPYDDVSDDELLERYAVYKYYVDNMRKSGKSASLSIQNKLKELYDEAETRDLL